MLLILSDKFVYYQKFSVKSSWVLVSDSRAHEWPISKHKLHKILYIFFARLQNSLFSFEICGTFAVNSSSTLLSTKVNWH